MAHHIACLYRRPVGRRGGDGRRKGYSIGASLTQVAQRMIELGCVTALSLDGGGSTTLCVTLPEDGNAGVYNTPSEGSLRAVTNHIFLVASNEPSGTLDHIALRTESNRVLAGAQVLLRASAIDTNYIPMDKEVSIASDRGSVQTDELGNTVLTAPKTAGTVTVGAKVGGKYTTDRAPRDRDAGRDPPRQEAARSPSCASPPARASS